MAEPATRRDLLWGYAAQGLNVGAGLILMPVVLHRLAPEDVGLWFVFVTLAGLAQLLEFGFQPTLARARAYVQAGARTLSARGVPAAIDPSGTPDPVLLATLTVAARHIHRRVAALAALALLVGGSAYVASVLEPTQSVHTSLAAWLAYAGGFVLTLAYGWVPAMLQGRGDVTAASQVVVVGRGTLIVLGAIALLAGLGLPGLGLASMAASVAGTVVGLRLLGAGPDDRNVRDDLPPRDRHGQSGDRIDRDDRDGRDATGASAARSESARALARTLWTNASRLGLVQAGAFLIVRGNILIASSLLGLAEAASYAMTVTVLIALCGVANVVCAIHLPHMNRLQARGDRAGLAALLGEILVLSWLVYGAGLAALALGGDALLTAIGSGTPLLPLPLLLALGAVFLLELNHSIAGAYLTTVNEVPFVSAALWSGLAVLVASLALVGPFGAAGLVAAQGVVQLAYNNWKWPREALAHLQRGLPEVLSMGTARLMRR
jgi:O-antigen/teichoic acid export membrane protein